MRTTEQAPDVAATAATAATAALAGAMSRRAAKRAGVEVKELASIGDAAAAAELLAEVWASPGGDGPISADLLRVLALTGNYVAGAFSSGELAGASVAFAAPGLGDCMVLHSHVTAVSGARHRTGVGGALKLHQRAWALEHGFEVITWTFDPLVARNARFNLSKLAARVDRYLVNLYGELDDVINSGGESDRLLVRWDLADDVVAAAAAGKAFLVDDSNAEDVHKVALPADIELLRKSDPTAARAWRLAMRGKLAGVLDHGGQVLGLAPSGEYVVQAATPRGQSR